MNETIDPAYPPEWYAARIGEFDRIEGKGPNPAPYWSDAKREAYYAGYYRKERKR